MNDVVLKIDEGVVHPRLGRAMGDLTIQSVLELGQELFAQHPLAQRTRKPSAERLAALIFAKAPSINAAMFLAPRPGCAPREVTARLADTPFEVMASLYKLQGAGLLTADTVSNRVWRKMAA
ncbi:MAG TPA: hypothetical protein VGC92_07055 [Phenylobacterium sp.]